MRTPPFNDIPPLNCITYRFGRSLNFSEMMTSLIHSLIETVTSMSLDLLSEVQDGPYSYRFSISERARDRDIVFQWMNLRL